MNKTQLRSQLSKEFGVTLSAADFGKLSVAELEAMVTAAKANAQNDAMSNLLNKNQNNNIEGDVNMNTNINTANTNTEVKAIPTMAELIAEVQDIMNSAAKATIQRVNAHTTKVGEVIKHTVDTRFDSLEAKVDAITNILKPAETNSDLSIKQYNKLAATLKPMGTVKNNKGEDVNYFGVCADCGEKITSPNTVAWGMLNNNNKVVCYGCQKKQKANNPRSNSNNNAPTNTNPLTKECPCCHKKITYKSVEQMQATAKKYKEHNIKFHTCKACVEIELNKRNNITSNTPVSHENSTVNTHGFSQVNTQDNLDQITLVNGGMNIGC